jgi:uncharacterized membrane protein YfcA
VGIFLVLIAAALLGGASNALAGGGTFLTFPALLLAGVSPVMASATGSLVLLPGAFASAWVYRDTLTTGAARKILWPMLATSLAGALAGSILLMSTSNATFSGLVPWLLLGATAVFTAAPKLRELASRAGHSDSLPALLFGQLLISAYGGYFGAGMGVLMIALYLVASGLDIQTAAGLRMICSCAINTLSVIVFALKGAIDYHAGIPMFIASVVGGYVGALLVKRLDAKLARRSIMLYAWALTAWFFGRMLVQALKS